MKIRIALIILLTAVVALACGLLAACTSGHEHDFVILKIDTQKTCTEDGWATYYCSVCYERKEDIIPAGHTFDKWNEVVKVGCENEGYREHRCLLCALKEGEMLPARGHIGEWYTLVEPGCAYTGMEVQDCSVCGGRSERPLSAVSHEYVNGVCKSCGRRDWSVVDIHDVDLYNSEYGFRALANEEMGANMQALYLLIDADARDFHNAQGIYANHSIARLGEYDYSALNLTFDQAVAVWKTYTDDHPLYYWLGRTVYYGDTLNVPVDDEYITPLSRLQMNEVIYGIANEWREEADDNAYLAALSFHDKIIYAIDYAYLADGITPQTANWAHNIVGVFTGQGAVCEGYARAFQMLLNMKGIDNVFVTGESKGSAHAWNLAKLDDGEWYWFDLTYDDVPGWMWGVKYNYFAVTDNQDVNWIDGGWVVKEIPFIQNHTPDSGTATNYLYPLPERSETPYKGMGEIILRQTFTVGEFTYALVGYNAVQLVKCSAEGEIFVPEYVKYGVSYEVISIGSLDEDGRVSTSFYDPVFTATKLTTLHIPHTVRFLWETARPNGDDEMSGASVEAYMVDENNQYFESVDGVLFTKGMFTLIAYPCGSPRTEYYIPDEVTYIADMAFRKAENLRSLTVGSGVYATGSLNWGYGWSSDKDTGGFSFVSGGWDRIFNSSYRGPAPYALEEIYVNENNPYYCAENGVLFNRDKTIVECVISKLTEVTIPATVTSFGYDAFMHSHVMHVIFEGTLEQWKQLDKGNYWNLNGVIVVSCLGDL